MITLHSIDLKKVHDRCFAEAINGMCRILTYQDETCRTHKCKFYKPLGCKEWIRVEDRQGVNLIPPEEFEKATRRKR